MKIALTFNLDDLKILLIFITTDMYLMKHTPYDMCMYMCIYIRVCTCTCVHVCVYDICLKTVQPLLIE